MLVGDKKVVDVGGGSARLSEFWMWWAQESSFDCGHRHAIM
jgi:hypothetical protein